MPEWKGEYRAISAQDNFDVAGFFEAGLGGPGIGASGLTCTAGEGVPFGFGSTPHAGADSPQPVPVVWNDESYV